MPFFAPPQHIPNSDFAENAPIGPKPLHSKIQLIFCAETRGFGFEGTHADSVEVWNLPDFRLFFDLRQPG